MRQPFRQLYKTICAIRRTRQTLIFGLVGAAIFIATLLFFSPYVYAAFTADGLVLSLNLSENGGETATDSSDTGNDATVQGTPTWTGGDITFDGSDDRLLVGDAASLDGPSHSYEIWFTMPDSSGWDSIATFHPRLIDKIPNDNASGTNILISQTTRQVQVFFAGSSWSNVTTGSNSGNILIATNALDYSTTYHIVFTYDNSAKLGRIYINDTLAAAGTTSGTYVANDVDLAIGGRPGDALRNIVGTFHRISAYNKALSTSDVAANYAAGADYDHSTEPDPDAVSAAQSSLSAAPSSVRANGTATATVTVTANNYAGEPLAGQTVTLAGSRGATDTITPSSVVTDSNGSAQFSVLSSTTGEAVLTAVAGGVTLTDTATITFTDQYVTTTGIDYSSSLDGTDLVMDVAYDADLTDAPILLVLHGYSGPFSGTDIVARLAQKGVFAIKTYKRSYGGSNGTPDDSGRELYDFYDAIEYVKSHYDAYVDPTNQWC